MGTNFYWHEQVHCPHCKRTMDGEGLHIGKSSAGWVFALHIHGDDGINSLSDWVRKWVMPGSVIKDEYGARLTPGEMLDRIVRRSNEKPWTEADLRTNGAEKGPENLARAVVDGSHCVGHGEGTWSHMTGEFS